MDAAVVTVVSIWHTEKTDDADTAMKRAEQLSEVAEALEKKASERMITERPRNRMFKSSKTAKKAKGGGFDDLTSDTSSIVA